MDTSSGCVESQFVIIHSYVSLILLNYHVDCLSTLLSYTWMYALNLFYWWFNKVVEPKLKAQDPLLTSSTIVELAPHYCVFAQIQWINNQSLFKLYLLSGNLLPFMLYFEYRMLYCTYITTIFCCFFVSYSSKKCIYSFYVWIWFYTLNLITKAIMDKNLDTRKKFITSLNHK